MTFENHSKVKTMVRDGYTVAECPDGSFLVSREDRAYHLVQSSKPHECLDRCRECDACKHEFSCTCYRNQTLREHCKHIHFLHFSIKPGVELTAEVSKRPAAGSDRASKKQRRF